jgi:predicted DNA-binding transcriptional regulator YafY
VAKPGKGDRYGSLRLALEACRLMSQSPQTLKGLGDALGVSPQTARRIIAAVRAVGIQVTAERPARVTEGVRYSVPADWYKETR